MGMFIYAVYVLCIISDQIHNSYCMFAWKTSQYADEFNYAKFISPAFPMNPWLKESIVRASAAAI